MLFLLKRKECTLLIYLKMELGGKDNRINPEDNSHIQPIHDPTNGARPRRGGIIAVENSPMFNTITQYANTIISSEANKSADTKS